jgi:ornithine cyclodeaminase/alanine dehydrogenase-like protein (mu-crystallin family)
VEALRVLFPLEQVIAYDVNAEAALTYAKEMKERFGLKATVVNKPQEAVTGCDLVVTAGPILKKPHRTIQAGWLDEGAFASLVDFDSYWHPDAMKETTKFCTDDLSQLNHYRGAGYFQEIPAVYADLGELVAGKKPGRATPKERTMAANLGLAMDDMATAPLILKRATEKGIGTWLPL